MGGLAARRPLDMCSGSTIKVVHDNVRKGGDNEAAFLR